MAAKKLDDQQIQHCIKVLDALAQSGQSVKAFAQTQGMSYAQLRGWQMHGARWRAQQAGSPLSQERVQVQLHAQAPQALVAKPTMACDFVQAQVTPERVNPNGASALNGRLKKPVVFATAVIAPTTSTAWVEPPPIEPAYMPAAQSSRPAYSHDPPNPSQVQIICTQGLRSAVVNWPTGAPLECAQWLKAYLT
jgi:hypothetical protein